MCRLRDTPDIFEPINIQEKNHYKSYQSSQIPVVGRRWKNPDACSHTEVLVRDVTMINIYCRSSWVFFSFCKLIKYPFLEEEECLLQTKLFIFYVWPIPTLKTWNCRPLKNKYTMSLMLILYTFLFLCLIPSLLLHSFWCPELQSSLTLTAAPEKGLGQY